MKKFTKGCLMTALVMFLLGCAICLIGAMFGGFRQLRNADVYGLTGIPFRFYRAANGIHYGFFSDREWEEADEWAEELEDFEEELEELDDWEDDLADQEQWDSKWEIYRNWENMEMNGAEKIQLGFTKDTLRNLDVMLGACEFLIKESPDDNVWLSTSGDMEHFRYHEDGDTLHLVRRETRLFWKWIGDEDRMRRVKVHLYLPAGIRLNSLDVAFGAGIMETGELAAQEAHISVGAGVCRMEGLVSEEYAEIHVGAGEVRVKDLTVPESDFEIGAGQLYIDNAKITRDADVVIGVGNVEICGIISGNLDAECSMGNLLLRMDDAEQDHNYEIECSLGNVEVGRNVYTSVQKEKTISNGSSSTFEIECSMGNVTVTFAE